ncbi:MAG: hypothetical protein GY833_22425 [Aestuariibacter sp.]|nr:hypothetical protein [Aestuariibacter sp.]
MESSAPNIRHLQRFQRDCRLLWIGRIAALAVLAFNIILAVMLVYKYYALGDAGALAGLYPTLAGGGIGILLVTHKFWDAGWFSVNFLRAAGRDYESLENNNTLRVRYRNFKRARKAAAELL